VHAVLNEKAVVSLLLDTGATRTLIRPEITTHLDLQPNDAALTQTVTIIGGRQVSVPLFEIETLTVGQAVTSALLTGVVSSFPEAPFVDGLLGGDFLEQFAMVLDYTRSRLWLTPLELRPRFSTPLPDPRRAISLRLAGTLVLVQAVLNHTAPVTLLLDTGASYSLLTPEAALRSGIRVTPEAPTQTLVRADGQRYEVPFAPATALTLGPVVVEQVALGLADVFPQAPMIDGVLGVDVLERFTVTLDWANRRMWLEPRS